MAQSFPQNHLEFAHDVRKTCHDLNNFLMILQCQHEYLGALPSAEIESELAGVLTELGPLVEATAKDVHELSKKCREILEGGQ
jgi:hypothetical protein